MIDTVDYARQCIIIFVQSGALPIQSRLSGIWLISCTPAQHSTLTHAAGVLKLAK
jgi:hypothetical protein